MLIDVKCFRKGLIAHYDTSKPCCARQLLQSIIFAGAVQGIGVLEVCSHLAVTQSLAAEEQSQKYTVRLNIRYISEPAKSCGWHGRR